LRREQIELREVLKAAVETSRPLIEQRGHKLTVRSASAPIHIDGDPVRLAQVVSNLLNNAAKYTERGGRIWLTATRKGNDAVVKVRDTGIGISAEVMPQIFQMFAQADRAINGSAGGLGIGLTLVKRLIEMHGGTITAQSEGRGKGSEFIMRVPTTSACVAQPEIPTEEATTETSKPIRILVVDDNQDSADSLGLLLQLLGNEVRIAHDGLAGVNLANEFQPRVVLLDIGLPILNGFEAAERIRQQPWGKEAVMIAVTGWGETVDRQRSKKAGFDYHLVKPVDPDVLTRLLQSL
jgi:CheY-like chemotaxis protein